MDYNSLTAQIKKYAYRTDADFDAQVPNIIEQAMSRIYSEAKGGGFQKIDTNNFVAGDFNIAKPRDFKEPVSLKFTIPANQRPDNKLFVVSMEGRSYEYCLAYWPNTLSTGLPAFYSADLPVPQNDANPGAEIYIAPTPDFAYQYNLTYLSFPPLFGVGATRNFVTDKYPNLLLNACMVEAMIYLKYDERIPVFETKYKAALDAINSDTRGRYVDRTGKRDKT